MGLRLKILYTHVNSFKRAQHTSPFFPKIMTFSQEGTKLNYSLLNPIALQGCHKGFSSTRSLRLFPRAKAPTLGHFFSRKKNSIDRSCYTTPYQGCCNTTQLQPYVCYIEGQGGCEGKVLPQKAVDTAPSCQNSKSIGTPVSNIQLVFGWRCIAPE